MVPLLRPAALIVLALVIPCPARASEPSAWSTAHGAAIRLVPGDKGSDGTWRAGVEIRLEPGWKTYWRTPGDSGVAAVFDWSGSSNVADVAVLWPAPERFADGAGESIGYSADVILPLTVTPRDPTKPVGLSLALQYGACKDICVPATGEATLALDETSPAPRTVASLVEDARKSVPVLLPLGAEGPLSITRIVPDLAAAPPRLAVDARADAGAILLVEGAADWYLPQPHAEEGTRDGIRRFTLALEGLPKGVKLSGAMLRLTLAGTAGAVETTYILP